MKQLLILLSFLIITDLVFAQQPDTTFVQCTQFSDGLDKRRAWWVFPPDTGSYRKILMYHKLKCDPTLISNPTGSGCGEWDAGANFYLYWHNNTDSDRYRVGKLSYPDTVRTRNSPTYSIYQSYQDFITYSSTTVETPYIVGSGNLSLSHALQTSLRSGKAQYLYQAGELTTAGVSAGSIDKLEIDITTLGADLNGLTIKMKHSALDSITTEAYETDGFETVYQYNTPINATGTHTFNLTSPFAWDGTSNIAVEFTFTNSSNGSDFSLNGSATPYPSAVYSTQDDQYLEFDNGTDYINIEADSIAAKLDQYITISFWANGDLTPLNGNNDIFSATTAEDRYELLIRLPQSNGRVYWYAGRDDNGLDNLNTANAPAASTFEGWNHWAFVKNAGSGAMYIYHNGVQLEAGTGYSKLMEDIATIVIGNSSQVNTQQPFYGQLNELRIWNVPMSAANIRDWMYRDIDATHPFYNNLVAYYPLDGNSATAITDVQGNGDGAMFGMPQRKYVSGEDQFRNMEMASERPNLTFVQGTYVSTIDSTLVIDTVYDEPSSIVVSHLELDMDNVGMTAVPDDTMYTWLEGYNTTYDQSGTEIGSVLAPADNLWYNRYEEVNTRFIKYITAYGNFLDLGDGFTWVYDITDYAMWFKDTIDLRAGDGRELLDLRFEFISGTPPRKVLDIDYMDSNGSYDQLSQQPNEFQINPHPNATDFGITSSFSGHGFNNATNCSEFCWRNHYLEIGGTRRFEWELRKECADNPLYPQGGTWIYDRTGWCPGSPGTIYHFGLNPYVTAGVPTTVGWGVDPDPTGTEYGNWNSYIHFMSYGPASFANDVDLVEIISPNAKKYHNRLNPVCNSAEITIRNTGSTALGRVDIKYRAGAYWKTYRWQGFLPFMESTNVKLPINDTTWWGNATTFEVVLVSPNNQADENLDNNRLKVAFEYAPILNDTLIIHYRTNSRPTECTWSVRNASGIEMAASNATVANILYRDTVYLETDCYSLEINDSDDDGLSFFANNDGNGYIRLYDIDGTLLEDFDPDFGKFILHQFTTMDYYKIDTTWDDTTVINSNALIPEFDKPELRISPNPSTGIYNLYYYGVYNEPVTIEVFDQLGKVVVHETINGFDGTAVHQIDLSGHSNGIYHVRSSGQTAWHTHKIIKME